MCAFLIVLNLVAQPVLVESVGTLAASCTAPILQETSMSTEGTLRSILQLDMSITVARSPVQDRGQRAQVQGRVQGVESEKLEEQKKKKKNE